MTILKKIENEKQVIARTEKSIALEKLKLRRADTRRKIELGGLVIKSGLGKYDKPLILGAVKKIYNEISADSAVEKKLRDLGEAILKG
jgi:hypothetical protein